jgi:hypothetical protein
MLTDQSIWSFGYNVWSIGVLMSVVPPCVVELTKQDCNGVRKGDGKWLPRTIFLKKMLMAFKKFQKT